MDLPGLVSSPGHGSASTAFVNMWSVLIFWAQQSCKVTLAVKSKLVNCVNTTAVRVPEIPIWCVCCVKQLDIKSELVNCMNPAAIQNSNLQTVLCCVINVRCVL